MKKINLLIILLVLCTIIWSNDNCNYQNIKIENVEKVTKNRDNVKIHKTIVYTDKGIMETSVNNGKLLCIGETYSVKMRGTILNMFYKYPQIVKILN